MVKIRLARFGSKKRPFYHIVASDVRSRRDSSPIERMGFYNPIRNVDSKIDIERIKYWQSVGAQTTDSARKVIASFLKTQNQPQS